MFNIKMPDSLNKRNLIFIFILAIMGIIFISTLYMLNYRHIFLQESEKQLESIADLKVREIVQWRKERLGDASLFHNNMNFSELAERFINNPSDKDARRRIIIWMDKVNSAYKYNRVNIYDSNFNNRLNYPDYDKSVEPFIFRDHEKELKTGKILFHDLYSDEHDGRVYMMILIPLFDEFPGGSFIGTLTMRIDPEVLLYPIISYWPVISGSIEVHLIRQEGDYAVILNDLNFKKEAALNHRIPLTETKYPVVKAVLQQEGVVDGVGLRGERVIAAIGKVPDSPWSIVAHINKSEVYSNYINRLVAIIVVSMMFIAVAGIVLLLLWKQYKMELYRRQFKDIEKLRSAEKEKLLLGSALDQSLNEIFIFDAETYKFVIVNKGGCENTGYSMEELRNMTPVDLNEKYTEEQLMEIISPLRDGDESIVSFFTTFMRKNSSTYPVEVHLSINRNEKLYIATVIDITGSKQMVQALEENMLLLQTLVETIPDLVWLKNPDGIYMLCNPMIERFFGKSSSAIIGKSDYDFVDKMIADLFRENDIKAVEAGRPRVNEEWVTFADDGHRVLLETIKMPMSDKKGNLIGVLGIARDITERHMASEALKRSEEHYRMLFEQNPAPMLIYRKDSLDLLAVNGSFLHHYGYSNVEALKMKLADLYPDEEKKQITELAERLEGYANVGEWHHLRKDGSIITVIVCSNDLVYMGEKTRVAVITDVTALKLLKDEIRESEERYGMIFEHMTDAFLLTEPDGKILTINPAGCRIFGRSEEEISAIGRQGLLDDSDPRLFQGLKMRADTGFFQGELTGIKGDGEKFPIMVSSFVFTDSKGIQKTATIIRDITETKFAFELLNTRVELINYSESHSIDELMIRTLDEVEKLTGSSISFFHFLEDDQKTLYLQAWSTQTSDKFCKAEGKGMHYDIDNAGVWIDCVKERSPVIHNDYNSLPHRKGLPEGHAPVIRELVVPVIRKDKITAILGVGNKSNEYNERELSIVSYLAGVIWDIIARKQAEEQLRVLNADLEERVSQRTSELEQANRDLESFSYSVSHDLRAPLRHIKGFIDLLMYESAEVLNEKSRRYIGVIGSSALRMGQLIDDLLSFSRLGRVSLAMRDVKMNVMLDEVLQEFKNDIEIQNIEITKMELPEVVGDASLLRIVLMNIISNAVKYTSKKPDPVIEIGFKKTDSEYEFFVRDNGAGFDMRYADKLFGVFQRLHGEQEYEGTGIGLAMAKNIVERHGGKIRAEGEVGKGACFYFTLHAKK